MSKKNWSNILSALARTALAFVFIFGQTAWAIQGQNATDKARAKEKQATVNQSSAAAAKASASEEETATEESSSAQENSYRGGPHEGIKVHGHWTIDVKNPDGTTVKHVEFENSLTQATGASLLAGLLNSGGSQSTLFLWSVQLGGTNCPPYQFPDGTSQSFPGGCVISQPNPNASATIFPAQTYTLLTSVNGGAFVLTGTMQAPSSSTITSVSTQTASFISQPCLAAPAAPCVVVPEVSFTSKLLDGLNGDPQPVSISSGQTIAVTVNISFS